MKVLAYPAVVVAICFLAVICLVNGQRNRPLSVHILDNTSGGNAANITCLAFRGDDKDRFTLISTRVTNVNGRVSNFMPASDFTPGVYRLQLNTKQYFNSKNMSTFWPHLEITFIIRNTASDHHIPVALTPFGFQTYRGS